MEIEQAVATLGIDVRLIEDQAERIKDRPEVATLFGVAARLREAKKALREAALS